MESPPPQPIEIAVAILRRDDGCVLVRRRPDRADHLAGLWEWPGGKRRPNETLAECAVRECREELGIPIVLDRDRPPLTITHAYPERTVAIAFFLGRLAGPAPADARWVPPRRLLPPPDGDLPFPAANAEAVRRLLAGGPFP